MTIGPVITAAIVALALSGCGSSPVTTTATPMAAPSAQTAAKWPSNFGFAYIGMPRAALIKLMGAPTEVDTDGDKWQAFGYLFTAAYDTGQTAAQLDVNEVSMTDAQKAQITYDQTRP